MSLNLLAKKYEGERFPTWGIGRCCYGSPQSPGSPDPETGAERLYSGWFVVFPLGVYQWLPSVLSWDRERCWHQLHFLWTDYAGFRVVAWEVQK
jgi:hypothetical protein